MLLVTGFIWIATSTQTVTARQGQPRSNGLQVQALPFRPNFHVIYGAGGNVGVQVGLDGVMLVDAGSGPMSSALVAAIRSVTDEPIRYIINTGADADHIGGNEALAKAGSSLFLRPGDAKAGMVANEANSGAAAIVAREAVTQRMTVGSGSEAPYPSTAWPTEPFSINRKDLFLNREPIEVLALPAAHSDADSLVFFRRSDVVAVGDVFDYTRFPTIDLAHGGSIQGEIDALNKVLEIAVPSVPMPWLDEGGTIVIPGHGRIGEEAEVVDYRDMVTIIRDRVQDGIKRGLTVEQIKAANPTSGWRRRFGTDSGPWTTDMFVEAIYKSLTQKR